MIIVEGELDKLAVEEATGRTAVLSIPAGAAAPRQHQYQHTKQWNQQQPQPFNSGSTHVAHTGKKFAYVHHAQPLLQGCQQIMIAVDGDEPGFYTACQLAERLGPERCWYLPWPAAVVYGAQALKHVAELARQQGMVVDVAEASTCKDANDVLMVCGPESLKLYLEYACTSFTDLLASGVGPVLG